MTGVGVAEVGTSWREAWARARESLAGALPLRLEGASPGVEIAGLDWGGDGDLVVLHHANGFCAATLAPIAKALSDRYRVVSLDARGHGDSTPVAPLARGGDRDAYAWEVLASDVHRAVRSLLDRTGRSRVELAIGHSFGGALLLRAASVAPSDFARLLLCDPVILPPRTPAQGAARSSENPLAASTRLRRDRFPSREAAFDHFRSRGLFARFTPEALALYVGEGLRETAAGELALKCDREVEAAVFDGGGAVSLVESVEAVTAEVQFVHAQRGNFPADYFEQVAARMARARSAGVESLDVGHLFPLEEPERVLALAEACLASRPDERAATPAQT